MELPTNISTDDVNQFIEKYDGSKINGIDFVWNSKHASDVDQYLADIEVSDYE